MKQYSKAEPLIFIHTPKAGGTTTNRVFKKWFKGNFHLHYMDEVTEELPSKIDPRRLHEPQNPLVIYGHFNSNRGFGVEDYYPEVSQFITILRDPFELTVSGYFDTRARSSDWKRQPDSVNMDLDEFVSTTSINMLNHFPREVTLENYREIVDEYFIYIGITEDLDRSMYNIASCLELPKPWKLGVKNKVSRNASVSKGVEVAFRKKHQLEFAVYEYAKELHESFEAKPERRGFSRILKYITKSNKAVEGNG